MEFKAKVCILGGSWLTTPTIDSILQFPNRRTEQVFTLQPPYLDLLTIP